MFQLPSFAWLTRAARGGTPGADSSGWTVASAVVTGLGFGAFVLYYAIGAFRVPWDGDIHFHLATVRALYDDLWVPGHEVIAVEGRWSVSYSPYVVLTAMAGRLLEVTPYRALQIAGVANLAIYAAAIILFFRTFGSVRTSPLPALFFLITSLFLRSSSSGWSSETDYLTLQFLQAYPSFLAWSLALLAFVLAERVLGPSRGVAAPAGLALLIAFLVLTHPITASWVIGIVAVRAATALLQSAWSGRGDLRGWFSLANESLATPAKVLCATAIGVGSTLLWPYFSPTLLAGFGGAAAGVPSATQPFLYARATYILALLALAARPCWRILRAGIPGARTDGRSLVTVAFLATLGAFVVFRHLGLSYGERYVYFMLFFPQVIVADVAGTAVEGLIRRHDIRPAGWNLARLVGAAYLVLFGTAVVMTPLLEPRFRSYFLPPGWLWNAKPTEHAFHARWDPMREALGPGDVVMMPLVLDSNDIAAVTGARFVAVPFRFSVPDWRDREASTNLFFTPGLDAVVRLRELRRWRVNRVVLVQLELALEPEMEALLGPPIWRDEWRIVHAVPAAERAPADAAN